ncbi:GD12103 [Drosophila simulans]|uniref:GD12103 n=1 Tax=Drosophila simulans TaxID=7240 RepID=B4QK70_DROSI|nr:GD12103 [Drosophila simulans]
MVVAHGPWPMVASSLIRQFASSSVRQVFLPLPLAGLPAAAAAAQAQEKAPAPAPAMLHDANSRGEDKRVSRARRSPGFLQPPVLYCCPAFAPACTGKNYYL